MKLRILLSSFVLFFLVFGLLSPGAKLILKASALDDSVWINNDALSVTQDSSNEAVVDYVNFGYPDCYQTTLKTQQHKHLVNKWIRVGDGEVSGCALQTPLGIVLQGSGGTYVQFTGTDHAQAIVDRSFRGLSFIAVPGQRTLILGGGVNWAINKPYPTYLFDNLAMYGESVIDRGKRKFRINSYPDKFLADDGTVLPIRNFTFSRNGQWMVFRVNEVLMRMHLQSGSMQTFARASLLNSVGYSMAVSNDGRYVFTQTIQHGHGGTPNLYDLSGCEPEQLNKINQDIVPGCKKRNLIQFFRSEIEGFKFITLVRFGFDNQTLEGLARHQVNGSNISSRVVVQRADHTRPEVTYIGMGDSFASGEGDNGGDVWYEPGTDTKENLCHLSRRSYPYRIAQQIGLNNLGQTPASDSQFHSVACSGAIAINISGGSGYDETGENPLRDNQYIDKPFAHNMGAWLPGYNKQLEFINTAIPVFLTLSIGGNDVGFSQKLVECVSSAKKIPIPNTCKYAADPEERANVAKEIAAQYKPLLDTYKQLVAATKNKTKIYVVGYPQFVNPDSEASCGLNVQLNTEERRFIYEATGYMNQVVKAAARSAGVYHVDIEKSLWGYSLCSDTEDGLMAVNGLTEGNDKLAPWWAGYLVGGVPGIIASRHIGIGNESYHPNENGHLLMKDAILAKLNNDPGLFNTCPGQSDVVICPVDTDIPKPNDYFGVQAKDYVNWLNSPSTLLKVAPAAIPRSLVVHNSPTPGRARVVIDNLQPNSSAEVIVESEPLSLGVFMVDDGGRLDILVDIPPEVEAGFHTIHVLGTNLTDEQRDYYEHIFVPGSLGDINGNGIKDAEEDCGFVLESGDDHDEDGVDDACDSFIGDPPDELVGDTPGSDEINPKPPVNNPETVAGDEEQVSPPVAVASPTTQQNLNNFANGLPPQNNIPTSGGDNEDANISFPQVAAAVKSEGGEVSPGDNRQATPETTTTKYTPYIIALAIFLSLPLLFFALRKTHKHPLSN